MKIEPNHIYLGDCLELMPFIEDASIDMILCDLPYGTTDCSWDTIIPLEPLWEQYKRIIKNNGAIILTASQPFTTILIVSNIENFKYCWYWKKEHGTGFARSGKQPMRMIEEVCVFCNNQLYYNSQKIKREHPYIHTLPIYKSGSDSISNKNLNFDGTRIYKTYYFREPSNFLEFKRDKNKIHPTQKPVALFEYLIKTYTNEGDLVLDNCIGSGTTAIAALNTNRRYIGMEKEQEYYDKATYRINHRQTKFI